MFGNGCPFIHDDIGTLYGVPYTPRDKLPTVCGCGAKLTYAKEVVFVSFPKQQDEGRYPGYYVSKVVDFKSILPYGAKEK